MKWSLSAAALLLSMAACAQSGLPLAIESPQMDAYLQHHLPAKLIIQINNAPDSVKKVDVKCTFVTFGADFQRTKYYSTDEHGFLKITLDQNLPYQQIWLSAGDYLYAGVYINKDLKITIDVSQIKNKDGVYLIGNGVTYSGTDGELNTVMNKHILYKQEERGKLTGNLNELCRARRKYSADLFSEKTDSIWEALNVIENEFIQQYPQYEWAVRNETASEFYGWLCVAYWSDTMPKNLFARISSHHPYFTSNDGVLFYNYLNTYQTAKTRTIANGIKIIDSMYPRPKADILKTFFLGKGKDSFALTYPEILNSMKTAWCRKLVANELSEATVKQKKIDSLLASARSLNNTGSFIGTPLGQLPFGADLYKLDSVSSIDDLILNLKSKFRDKAMIIDFWATWCVPCLSEMPFSKKLHETNKDLPVEYIYICTNSSSNSSLWKNKIAEFQLPGTHIFMDEKIVEELKSEFNNAGSGFPTYVVIDAKGNLRTKAIEWIKVLDRDKLKEAVGLH